MLAEAEAEAGAQTSEAEAADGKELPAEVEATAAEEGAEESPSGVIEIGIDGDESVDAVFNTLVALLLEPLVEPEDGDECQLMKFSSLCASHFLVLVAALCAALR